MNLDTQKCAFKSWLAKINGEKVCIGLIFYLFYINYKFRIACACGVHVGMHAS